MGIVERKEREKQDLRSRILQVATEMFMEEGFDKTSIRSIAEKIEYSPATIYLHFKDKNELFHVIHEQGFDRFFQHLQPALQIADPFERLLQMGYYYLEFAYENPAYYDLMFIMRAPVESLQHADSWECGLRNFDLLRATVVECLEKGLMRAMDPETATVTIWSFMHGMTSLAIRNRFIMYTPEQLQGIFREAISNMLLLLKSPTR